VELAGQEPVVLNVPYEVDDFYGEIHHFVELVETGATEQCHQLKSWLHY
jgi:hypothetical protein